MFTGIVDHCGTIAALEQGVNSLNARVECEFTDLQEGESIAVDGICLTAIEPGNGCFRCNISSETLHLTTAGEFIVGRKINLERALRLGDRLGGHWVTGHIDQCGQIKHKQQHEEYIELHIGGLATNVMPNILKKGSIAVNGVSLTINEILPDGFQVLLIPHTLMHTNLGALDVGDAVNLEFDWMTRVIITQLKQNPLLNAVS